MDEEFTDAEIRAILKRAAMDRRQAEVRQRQERAGDPDHRQGNGATTESPSDVPPRKQAA